MILVTGATGHLGSETLDHLLKNTTADQIVAFARDEGKAQWIKENGVEVRTGDFDDKESLDRAMQGIDKVLLVSTVDEHRYQQHQNVVNAAKKAGVKHIVYTGVSMKNVEKSAIKPLMQSHFQTEDFIKASGLNYTFMRNTLYLDGIPMFVGEQVFENGIYLPAGDGRIPFALRREMGEAAANVLLQDGHKNKTYEITGADAYSYQDVANVLSELSGKEVSYTDADAESFPDKLKELGVPDFAVFLVVGFSADTKDRQFELVSDDLEKLLGRKPATLKEGLKEIYEL